MTARTRIAAAAIVASALASMALLPSYADLRWLPRTVGAVLVVGIVAECARQLGVPRALASLCSLAALSAYITALFARHEAIFGFIPGRDARIVLADLVRQGWHDISVLRAPVPSNQGLVLLTVAGVGLVAIAVDIIAVSMRRAALAGLPLLALFAVSAATVPDGVGWLPFLYGGIGYIALLLADSLERVSRWGRPLGAGRYSAKTPAVAAERAETGPLLAVGRRVGLAALGVALVVPAVIPGLHPGLFGSEGGAGSGIGPGGNSTVTTYNPITRIKRQLVDPGQTPLFRYGTDDPDPAYFRMTALDRFDGQGWSQGDLSAPSSNRVDKGLPYPSHLGPEIPTAQFTTEVAATRDFSVPWLPLPYPALAVAVDGDWRWEADSGAIFSTRDTTRGAQWGATSARVEPTLQQLRATTADRTESVRRDTAVDPSVVPRLLYDEAHRVADAGKTPFDKARRLQDYFHSSRFHYSTDVADTSDADVIAEFLQDGRGYCVQFASTMTLMARVLGIPARVAIGFTHGERQKDGTYVVTTHDAHSWPELFFDGIGWLAFEPTPRGDGQAQVPPYTTDAGVAPVGPSPGAEASPQPAPSGSASPGILPKQNPAGVQEGGGGAGSDSGGGIPGLLLVALIAVAALLTVPAINRWLGRRRRWTAAETDVARAHAAWRELNDDVRDLGFRWRVADSPRRAAERLIAATGLSAGADALHRLARAEERARYASPRSSLLGAANLADDERAVRRELAGKVSRPRRLAAVVVPRSTLAAAASVVSTLVADTLDLIDKGLSGLYRAVTPRRLRRG